MPHKKHFFAWGNGTSERRTNAYLHWHSCRRYCTRALWLSELFCNGASMSSMLCNQVLSLCPSRLLVSRASTRTVPSCCRMSEPSRIRTTPETGSSLFLGPALALPPALRLYRCTRGSSLPLPKISGNITCVACCLAHQALGHSHSGRRGGHTFGLNGSSAVRFHEHPRGPPGLVR